jgi:hypothetical protein
MNDERKRAGTCGTTKGVRKAPTYHPPHMYTGYQRPDPLFLVLDSQLPLFPRLENTNPLRPPLLKHRHPRRRRTVKQSRLDHNLLCLWPQNRSNRTPALAAKLTYEKVSALRISVFVGFEQVGGAADGDEGFGEDVHDGEGGRAGTFAVCAVRGGG